MDERTFAGRTVAYVFLSPNCVGCKQTFPQLQLFFQAAADRGTDIVVVTDTGQKQTASWLHDFELGGTRIVTPVIVAPQNESKFVTNYNGPLLFPYFSLIGADGQVVSRGILGKAEWMGLIEFWAGREEALPPVTTREVASGAGTH